MDLLDQIILNEANSVTPDDYKKITGVSLDEHMDKMKEFVAEVKARTTKAELEKPSKACGKLVNMPPVDMWQAMPMAAATPRNNTKDSDKEK